jgi:DnaJ-class molecular chaperone
MKNNPFAKMMNMNPNQGHRAPFGDPVQEIFSNLFGMGGMPPGFGGVGGDPFGMHFGPNVQIFKNGVPINMSMQKPPPITLTITINIDQVLTGTNVPIEIERWIQENGTRIMEKETLYVAIPQGIDENEIIVLKDKGNVVSESCKGDVKLFIKIINNTDLKRQGLDLILNKKISLKESLCGFTFDLKYLNNKFYTINNNLNNIIPPGHHKIIPNMGLVRDGHTGNLIIIFEIDFPTKLDDEVVQFLLMKL